MPVSVTIMVIVVEQSTVTVDVESEESAASSTLFLSSHGISMSCCAAALETTCLEAMAEAKANVKRDETR